MFGREGTIGRLSRAYTVGEACASLLMGFMAASAFGADLGGTVVLKPDQNVAAVVAAAPPGTKFIFSPGTYRMQSIVPKAHDSFAGQGAVILDGAELLAMQADGGQWSALKPRAAGTPGHCQEQHPRCWIVNDLFIDDQLQTPAQTLTGTGAGQWYYDDSSGKIVIGTNPAGHRVELGVTAAAFSGGAEGVEIRNLIVEKYASPPQKGAIGGANGKALGWTILETQARWNHGVGIAVGPESRVERCQIVHNGQLGLAAHGNNITVVNNEIAYNNYAGYDTAWEAGGSKYSGSDHLVVRSNYVHDNFGDGVWTDIDNIHTLFENNTVLNNAGEGIRHEISYDAVIRNNIVKGNYAGIVVSLSSNVDLSGNSVEVPANGVDGIRIANGNRGMGGYGPRVSHDVHVHNNVITFLGPRGRSGLSGPLATAANVTFDFDEYHVAGGGDNHWIWGGPMMSFGDLQKAGMELHGSVSKGLPAASKPGR
jgi:parallel beta-helix repeat protein